MNDDTLDKCSYHLAKIGQCLNLFYPDEKIQARKDATHIKYLIFQKTPLESHGKFRVSRRGVDIHLSNSARPQKAIAKVKHFYWIKTRTT